MFEDFEPKNGLKDGRRFGLSLLVSGLCYAALGGGVVLASAAARKVVQEEELVQIEFTPPPEPVAEPEPPPPPPPEATPPPSARPKVQRQELAPPKEIPKEKPPESDAKLVDAPEPGSGQEGFLDGVVGGTGTAPAAVPAPPPPPPPPPPPAPKAQGPVHLPETATAPVAKPNNVPPEYPESARKSGMQAVVVAKVVIAADGRVTSVEIMRGPDVFHEPVKRALLAWRYEPARLPDGTAISVFRIIQLPFKLENM